VGPGKNKKGGPKEKGKRKLRRKSFCGKTKKCKLYVARQGRGGEKIQVVRELTGRL